ncbi:MAG: hypothetical protein JO193_08370, partial [Candidatus Eremiobacteraeota bacterium]|nr:hypothetical protein [Candidatus Eremiobacteraeota bacterium]
MHSAGTEARRRMTGYSPMLDQYFGMKARHPEALLLSRVGDFYEAYGEDAETVARALSIALTSKEAGSGRRVAMAGVPHHALAQYLQRLVDQRWIIALAEQLELPQPNKLVRRDVVRIITPGTLIEENLLDNKQNNYLAAVTLVGDTFALAYADISTGRAAATAVDGDDAYEELLSEIERVGPAEIVADVPANVRSTMSSDLQGVGARLVTSGLSAVEQRDRTAFSGFSLDASLAMHQALDALLAFVRKTGVTSGDALSAPEYYRRQTFVALDAQTRKNLELARAQGANAKATLLATLDRCATAMGSRMLSRWILAPLVGSAQIKGRADCVQVLLSEPVRREALQELLRGCFDLERIAQKVRFRRAGPRDLASLRRTLEAMRPLPSVAPPGLLPCVERIGAFENIYNLLQQAVVEDPAVQISDGGVIRAE